MSKILAICATALFLGAAHFTATFLLYAAVVFTVLAILDRLFIDYE